MYVYIYIYICHTAQAYNDTRTPNARQESAICCKLLLHLLLRRPPPRALTPPARPGRAEQILI